jgi:acetyl esterase/lipase
MPKLTSSFGLRPDSEARLRELGPILNEQIVEKSREIFAGTRDMSLPAGAERYSDLGYGGHPRQKLDIYRPAGTSLPIVIFVPGGGFTGGDKSFYAHIPCFFARQGFVGVGVNYRLAPEFLWPSGAQDVASAIDWMAENAGRFGGDPSKIFLVGQSAGAAHAGAALFDPRLRSRHYDGIRAAVLMSGLYDIVADSSAPNATLYYGDDPSTYTERSSAHYVSTTRLPVMLTISELEPRFFAQQFASLLSALTKRDGHVAPFAWLRGHNHLSPVLNMGSIGDELGPALTEAFRDYC